MNSSMSNLSNSTNIDLYFIIAKFLGGGPCKKTFEVLVNEVQEHGLIPERIDWTGERHQRSYEEFESLHPRVSAEHLELLLSQLHSFVDKLLPIPHLTPTRPSLLSSSRLSLLRTTTGSPIVYPTIQRVIGALRWGGYSPAKRLVHLPNMTTVLGARSLTGRFNKRHVFRDELYSSRLQLYKRTVGHLSSVYCVLFDRTGRYIVTGSDDTLVKLWSVRDGRLLATLRGAAGEISDIAVDPENTMVAAGCCDKTIRVWNLQTLSPIAVLISHTGMITAVQFCPSPDTEDGEGLLVSTGGDGCVAFWTYTRTKGSITFRRKPLKFNERVRPGHAQLICCSFSAGGTMLALGGVDHHVRVYRFGGSEGLEKMIEQAEHSDCVDSIQWCHEGLAFASGSRDGSALIWRYQRQDWHTTKLDMNISTLGNSSSSGETSRSSATTLYTGSYRATTAPPSALEQKKVLVTMVGWSLEDQYVVTCSSDHHVRVWDSTTGRLVRLLTGHTDDAFVVEAHPTNVDLVLTAGHDGQLMIWNVRSGALVCSFKNAIEGQGHGALFDAKWSPDGLHIAATDSHGHICLYGMGTNELCYKVPQELFFHTDYRPLVRDAHQYVLDEQTQLAPHLMPPPFLVNIDGNPYPPALQRLVPGREHCDDTMLVPNVIFNANGDREVFDVAEINAVNALHNQADANDIGMGAEDDEEEPPPLPAPVPVLPLPPLPPRPEPSPRLIPRPPDSPGFLSPDSVATDDRPRLVDQMIERLVREQQEQINLSFGSGDGGSGSEDHRQDTSSVASLVSPRPTNSSNLTFSVPGPSSGDRVPPPRISPLLVPRPSAPTHAPSISFESGAGSSRSLLANERRLSAPIDGELNSDRRLSSSSLSNHNLPGPSGINSVPERRPSQLETFHERHRNVSGAEHSYAAMANGMVGSPAASRGGARLVGDVEGVRHSTGNWQRESQEVKWAPRRVLVRSLSPSTLNVSRERRRCRADQEEESYMREASKEPLLDDADGNVRGLDGRDEDISPRSARQRRQQQRRQQQQLENSSNSGNRVRNSNTSAVRGQRSNRGTRAHSSRTRNGNEERATSASREVEGGSSSSYGTRGNREVGRGRYSQDYEDPNAVASHESSHSDDDSDDLSSSESSSSGESTDYSDWTAEQGINLEPPKRTAHRQKKSPSSRSKLRQVRNALATDDEEEEESQVNTSSEQLQEKRISKREKKKNPRYMEKDQAAGQCSASSDGEGPSASQHAPPARQRREVRGRLNNLNESSDSEPGEIPEAFRPPEWLTEIQPKRAPYFPQMGDELMYFMQGHMSYVDAVIKRKLYNIDMKSLPWTKPNSSIKECEYVKIIGIKYEIRPPRLCCLKLAILNPNTNRISTDTFTLKYHDIPDVLDFLVLKQMHDTSAARNWQVGDRFRCIIDDAWWLGTVSRRELPSRECPESLFMTYFVTWDNGETEKLSPWDMEPIGEVAEEHDSGTGIEVSSEELERLRYKWTEEDWPDGRDGGEEGRRIATGMGLVMGLAVAEPFLAPVDLSVYPNYAMIVEYPMDLSTIKSRLENGFYRRLNAVQFDVRYIATNAEKFNQRGSNIVRQARIVTELCLDLIKNPACRDPTARYHEIASSYHSPNASDLDAPGPSAASTSAVVNGNRRCGRPPKMTGQTWQQQCREVLRAVFERGDSMPFRYPVDLEQYPDYDRVVEVPMDLTTVREELSTHSYETPHQFASDVRLIFCNSKSYNTNKKSKIYSMTVRLEAFFEDKMKSVFSSYQAQEKAAKKSSKRGSKSGLTSRRQKSSSNGTKLSASSEPRPLSAAGSSRGHTLRSTVGTGRGACIAGLATSSVVRLRRLTNPYGPSPGSSSLQNGLAEDSNDEGDEKGGLCNEPVEDDEDSPAGDDSFGTRRSKRVAKLKRFLSSDDSDEDYSPVKKRPLEGSVRSKRKVTGTTRSNMPEAGSSSGVGVRSRITVQYQENSDSEQEEYVSPSSLISIPQNNLPHGEAGGASGSSKRVVLKLSFPLDGDQPGTETADSDTASTDDDGDAGGGDADNIAANACNGADDVSNKSVKRKLAIDSSDDQKENVENEGSGASSTDSTIDSLHGKEVEESDNCISGSKTNDSESSDSISNRPKKRRKLTVKKLTTPIESESSDSLQQNEGRRSNSHRRNGSLVDKKKIVPNIGRKMPIYKGSLVPGLNKKRQREDSEFECDDNDFQSSDYSEEEVDSKCKKPNKKKKVPSVRKSRRTVLDGDDDLGDEDFVVEDDNIDGRRESDETNSSSSSSSSSSGSSSDDAGRSEESDELLSNNRKSNKKNQLKHSKGIVKSSATSGKKIPLKYKPGKSSRKHLGSGSKSSPGKRGGLRGRKRGGLSGSAKRQKSWINDEDDDLLDYESGEEVMDGEQVIGKVYYNSDDDTSDDYTPSVTKKRGGRGGRRGASTTGFRRAIDACKEDEVRKSSRRQRKVRYDEVDDDDEDYDDLNVSSRGRVRRANTLMKDFI